MKFDFEKQNKINVIDIESLEKRTIAFIKRLNLL